MSSSQTTEPRPPVDILEYVRITKRKPYLGFRIEVSDPDHFLNNATGVRSRHPNAKVTPTALLYHLHRVPWVPSPFTSFYTTLDATRHRIEYYQEKGCREITVYVVWLHHHPIIYDAYIAARYMRLHKQLAVMPREVLLVGELDRACVLYEWSPETLENHMVQSRMMLDHTRQRTMDATRIYRDLMMAYRRKDEKRCQELERDRRRIDIHSDDCTGTGCLKIFQDLLLCLILAGALWKLAAGSDGKTIIIMECRPSEGDQIVFRALLLFTCAQRKEETSEDAVEAEVEEEEVLEESWP